MLEFARRRWNGPFGTMIDAFTEKVDSGGLFLIFTLAAALATSGLADGVSNLSSPWVTAGVGGLLLLALFLPFLIQLWRKTDDISLEIDFGSGDQYVPKRKGLIVLVSVGNWEEIPAANAIAYHASDHADGTALEALWLIASQEGETRANTSHYNAKKLQEKYTVGDLRPKIFTVQDADDPDEVFNVAQQAYRSAQQDYRFDHKDIIADITGGTKWMSIGLAYAGWPDFRLLQFMKAREKDEKGRAKWESGADPRQIEVTYGPALLARDGESDNEWGTGPSLPVLPDSTDADPQ